MSKSRPSYPPTKGDWDRFIPIVIHLYKATSLKVVMATMESRFGFRATERMYKARLSKSNVRKYGKNRNAVSTSRRITIPLEEHKTIVGPLYPTQVGDPTAALGLGFLQPGVFLGDPLMTHPNSSNASKVIFYSHQYTQMRLPSHDEAHGTTSTDFRRPTVLPPDEVLWQKLYKGLALLEQGMPKEAFDMLNSACHLARPVLLSQPRLLFRAIFMVFGTERWKRFTDVWKALLRFLADMASTVLGRSHPVALALNALRRGDILHSSAELTIRQLLNSLQPRLGPVHPEVLRTKRNLSVLLRRQSELNESEENMKETVTACEERLGITHIETLRCLRRLAGLYMHHGKYEDAEGLLVEALRRAGRPDNTLGPTTEDTDTFVYANRDLAIVAMQQNDMDKCRSRLQGFSYICRTKLAVAGTQQVRAHEEPPHPLTMVGAEQYIKDLVMAYDLHCDEVASRLMSSPARRLTCERQVMPIDTTTASLTAGPSFPPPAIPPPHAQYSSTPYLL